MKIQFIEPTWVLKMSSCEDSYYNKVEAIELMPEIFEVKSIEKSKSRQCSNIYLGHDNYTNDYTYYHLINVPNGLFKQINE